MLDLKRQLSGYIDAACPPVTAREVMGELPHLDRVAVRSRRVVVLCVAAVVTVIGATAIVFATRRDTTTGIVTAPAGGSSLVERLRGATWEDLNPGLGPGLVSSFVGWTGTELILTAQPGVLAVYDPAKNELRRSSDVTSIPATSVPTAPAVRDRVPVWTGKDLYLFGESNSARVDLVNPRLETPVANPPVVGSAVWTGSEVVMWSSVDSLAGAAYSPSTNTWRPIAHHDFTFSGGTAGAVWIDDRMYIVGLTDSAASAAVVSYTPATDTWQELSTIGLPTTPYPGPLVTPAVLGNSIVVFGFFGAGFRYDITSNTWSQIPTIPGTGTGTFSATTVTRAGGGRLSFSAATTVVDGFIVASPPNGLKIFDPGQSLWIEGPPSPGAVRLLSTPGALYGLKDGGTIVRLRY